MNIFIYLPLLYMKEEETREPRTVEGNPVKNTSLKSVKIRELLDRGDRETYNVTEKNCQNPAKTLSHILN